MESERSGNPHIPRVINLCYKTKSLPDFVVGSLKDLNPTHKVRLFDDAECRSFIGDQFGGEYAACFDHIPQGPIKADFWRCCILYKEGGIYFDVDVDHRMGVDDYLESDSTFLTSTSLDSRRVNPIVLASKIGNPVLKMCVEEYLNMFRSKKPYEYWSWSICPMLYRAMERVIGRPFDNGQHASIKVNEDVYQFVNEDGRAFTKYKGARIFNNHHRLYTTIGGQTMRGFVVGAKSPIFENQMFRIEVMDHPHADTFSISVRGDRVSVTRTDQDSGWGQDLMLKIKYKTSGRVSVISIGSSEANTKHVDIPIWKRRGKGSSSPKMLFIIAGEAFRHGQHGRKRDTAESFDPQMRASMSHVALMDHVRSYKGLDCDVVISSYRTKYERELVSWYGDRLIATSFRGGLVGLQPLVKEALAEFDFSAYESVFVTRIDIEHKAYFREIFDPAWQKIMFPSICWAHQGYLSGGPNWIPRVSDTMEFIPKRFLSRVKRSFHLSHEAWHRYVNEGMQSEDIGFMVDTFHDSDSAKDYNPIYRMASRKDCPKWYSPNLVVGPDRSPARCLRHIAYPDWRQPITAPYEDEDLILAYKYDSYIRKEQFNISLDKASRLVRVSRIDSDSGWDNNIVLMLLDKNSGDKRELFVGRSESNGKTVSLDYRPGVYEDDNFSISVRPHDFPDVFHLERDSSGGICVSRLDASLGWGQNLALTVTNKASGRKRNVRVGPSESNKKSVALTLDPTKENQRTRVALCIRGAVSRFEGASMTRGEIYRTNKGYVNYRAVAKSVEEHILKPNEHMEIDIFVHSWNRDLAGDLELLYKPAASMFEDNEMYADEILARCRGPKDFSGVSHALACKRVIQLKEQYERDKGVHYDLVVLYRPDVLLWKDMPLDLYSVEQGVFVNAHGGGNGDFHFVMTSDDASLFKGLYDSPLQGNPQAMHGWIKNYVEKYMNSKMIMDDIVPGMHQEVMRPDKMRAIPVNVHKLGLDKFARYGVESRDI